MDSTSLKRKRTGETAASSSSAAAAAAASNDGAPEEEKDLTVLRFQKRAMTNRLKEKNSEIETLKGEVSSLRQRRKEMELVTSRVMQSWQQLVGDLSHLSGLSSATDAGNAPDATASAAVAADSSDNSGKAADHDPFVSYVRQWLSGGGSAADASASAEAAVGSDVAMVDGDDDAQAPDTTRAVLDTALEAKVSSTKAIVGSLLNHMQRAEAARKELLARMTQPSSGEAAQTQTDAEALARSQLQTELQAAQQSMAQMALQNRELAETLQTQRALTASLETQVQELRNRSDEESLVITKLRRKCARLETDSAAAAEAAAAAAAVPAQAALLQRGVSGVSVGSTDPAAVPLPSPSSSAAAMGTEAEATGADGAAAAAELQALRAQHEVAVENLKAELEDMRELLQSKAQVEEALRKDNIEVKSHLQQVRNQVMPDEAVVQLPQYKALYFSFQELKQADAEKAGQIARMQARLSELQEVLHQERAAIAQERTQQASSFQAQISKLSESKDQLAREAESLKARLEAGSNTPEEEAKAKSQLLLKELQITNKQQYKELQTLRETLSAAAASDASGGGGGGQMTHYSVREITRRYKTEQKEWHEKERDFMTLIETYKTTSKETRQLADIRMAEAVLKRENEELKGKLETLSSAEQTKLLSELKKTVEDQKEELQTQQDINNALMAELEEMAKSYEAKDEQNNRLLEEASSAQSSQSLMLAERLKHLQAKNAWKSEREKWIHKAQLLNEAQQEGKKLVEELEARIDLFQKALAKKDEELRLHQQTNATLTAEAARYKERAVLTQEQLDEANGLLEQSSKSFKDELARNHAKDSKIAKLNEKAGSLQRKIDRLTSAAAAASSGSTGGVGGAAGGNASGLEQELSVLKRKLKCNVCSDRDKNCVLTKCGHMFCKECIDERMRVRLRKCPGCSLALGADDIKPVWF